MSWFSTAFRAIGSFVGSTEGRNAIGRAILGGANRALTSRGDRRTAREVAERDFESQRSLDNNAANQERESLLYDLQLKEWQRQQLRRERARGGANFAQFASPIPGYVNRAPMDITPVPMPVAPRINL